MEAKDFVKGKPKFISPAKVLEDLCLKSGCKVIDYASGAGHWTLAAAELVGPTGLVLAIEDDIGMLELLKGKASTRKLTNIEVEEVDIERGESKLAKPSDLVIVSNILHLVQDKASFAEKVSRLVNEDGRLLFIDWVPVATLLGPPARLRLTEEKVMTLFEQVGLRFACTVDTGWQHFGLIFDRRGDGCGWKE